MNNKLLEVAELFEEIKDTKGSKAKQNVLRKAIDTDIEELVKNILLYTYDIDKVYGIGKKTIKEINSNKINIAESDNFNNDIFSFLDYLCSINMNNEVKSEIKYVLNELKNDKVKDMFCKILLKDMRFGMAEKSINEVFNGLIWTMDIMLARSLHERMDKLKGEKFIITPKLDGIRLVVVNEPDNVKLISRQGKLITGCRELEEEIKKLPHNVYDGELILKNPDNIGHKELFKKTSKLVNSDNEDKKDLEFHVFDMLSIEDFNNKTNCQIASARKTFSREAVESIDSDLVKCVPILLITKDMDEIMEEYKKEIAKDREGIMLNKIDGFYEFKRSDNMIRIKPNHTIDVRIKGFVEGEGKDKGSLGAFIVDYKGFDMKVGSGGTKEELQEIWDNQDKYLGKIIEIDHKGETSNQQGGLAVRHASFKRLRLDKNEVNFNG